MRAVETIPDFLNRMAEKDASKGYKACGLRTTAEIAEYFDLTPAYARKVLNRLEQQGLITGYERCDISPGRPYIWGPAIGDDDPDGGEPVYDNDNEVDAPPIYARTGE